MQPLMVLSPFCFPDFPLLLLAVFMSLEELCEPVVPIEPELCDEVEELGEVELCDEVEPCEVELGEVELCDDP